MRLVSGFPRLTLKALRAYQARCGGPPRRTRGARSPVAPSVLIALAIGCAAVLALAAQKGDDPIRAGNKALDEMRLEDAKVAFEEAVASNIQVPKAKWGLAEVMARSGRLDDAERLYREALDAQAKEGDKPFPEAHAGLGLLLVDTGKWDEGAAEIKKARAQGPDYWPAIYGEARILLRDHKWDAAEKLLNEGSKKKGVAQGEDLFHRGWAIYYMGTNDLTEAETEALSAFHLNPANPVHGKLVAEVYERRNVPALAIAACEEVMNTAGVTPTASFVHFMGTLYQKVGRYNEARDSYLKAVSIDSTYTPVLKDLAGLFQLAKQYDKSAQIYMRYVEKEPGDVEAMVGLAGSLYDGGRYAQALNAAEKAMALDSTRTDVRLAYGRAALKSRERAMRDRGAAMFQALPDTLHWKPKDKVLLASYQIETNALEDARRNLNEVVAADSTNAEAYFQLGLVALKSNRAEEAVGYFDKAILRDPNVPLYHLNVGVAYFQTKQFDKAIPAIRRSIALDPKFVIGRTLLGQALIAVDSLSAAETQYKRALEVEPKNATALRGLGYCYLKRSAYQEAAGVYKSATEADPKNADAWVGLAQAYIGVGNVSGAEGALHQAQSIDPNNASLRASWDALNRARRGTGG
jgi:tetratricopeptide (TPR) repeat protein